MDAQVPGTAGLTDTMEPHDDRFAFVLPVVNPRNARVRDYGTVERMLRETLRSLCAQTWQDVLAVVICHRVPAWANEFAGRVRFLDVGDHPAFAANRNHLQVDKGMKYAIGCMYAIGRQHASLVMLMDGDDFMRTDLAERLIGLGRAKNEFDGLIIARGLNVQIEPAGEGFCMAGVSDVREFNRTCGSCRIFRADSLSRRFEQFDPGFFSWSQSFGESDSYGVVRPAAALLDHVDRIAKPIRDLDRGLIRVLGRHVRQKTHFSFAILDEPLAAKACGHGNHNGPRQGEIHWRRVLRLVDGQTFLNDFGLRDSPYIWTREGTEATFRSLCGMAFSQTLGRLTRIGKGPMNY